MGKKIKSYTIDEDLIEFVDDEAKKKRRSASSILVEIILQYSASFVKNESLSGSL